MTIHLSCGHVAEDGCFGVDVSWEGEDCVAGEGFVPTTFYASYCHKCAMDLARTEERAAIVAWLEKESTLCDCAAIYDGECVCGALDEYKTVPIERILLAIEAGKHLK